MKKIIACVLVAFNSVCCIVIETPQNEVVFVGQTMSFKCRTTNGDIVREWRFSNRSSESHPLKIFSNWNTSPPKLNVDRYNIDVDKFGSGVLLANNTQLEDAGTYTCLVENNTGQPIPYSAELIVLESDLKCESSADNNSLPNDTKKGNREIWCNVSYAGNLNPVVTWYGNDRKVKLPTDSEIHVDRRNWFYFNTTFQINSSDNGMVFSCEIHFKPTNTNETISKTRQATNIPGRKFTGCILNDSRNISTEPDGLDYSLDSLGWKPIVLSLVFAVLALFAGVALVYVILFKGFALKHFHCTDGSTPDIVQHVDNIRTEQEEQLFNSPFQGQRPIYTLANDHVAATSSTTTKSKVEQRTIVNEVNPEESLYYLDLNGAIGLSNASRTIPTNPYYTPEFNQSEYAAIDHTQQPPLPMKRK